MVNGDAATDSWEAEVEKTELLQRQSRASRRGSVKGLAGMFDQEMQMGGGSDNDWVDPPRIYLKGLKEPGIRHSRSLGDDIWESKLGIVANAEVMKKSLRESDQFVVLASDGLWEFCSNQEVCDLVMRHTDPLHACRALLAEAYSRWLQFEVRTDDITIILSYLDTPEGAAPRQAPQAELDRFEQLALIGDRASALAAQGVSQFMDDEEAVARPVRQGLSPEKKGQLSIAATGGPAAATADDSATSPLNADDIELFEKSEEELARIAASVRNNFIFQRVQPEKQRDVFLAMRKREYSVDDEVFRQGDPGDTFYVLEGGEFVVSMQRPNETRPEELFSYEQIHPHGANPCFGELGLMYSAKRPVTVTCIAAGSLWEIDRQTFRKVIMRASKQNVVRTLRTVEIFRSLSVGDMERLVSVLSERSFQPGDKVIRQGEIGTTFYVIAEGRARFTRETPFNEEQVLVELSAGEYFGERALLENEPRAATVVAWGDTPLKLLYISKDAFEEMLGSLQETINEYSQWRYKMAASKEFLKNAAGLGKVTGDDFMLEGLTARAEPYSFVLVALGTRLFTMKAASKV